MTDITELTPEAARESGSILIIVAARMARREFFTPLHTLCESGKRVVSTRELRCAVERAEEHMVSQVPKIVDGHDRLTKKLKEAESRNADLVEALEKAKAKADVYDMLRDDYGLREKGVGLADFVDWQANRIAELESRTVSVKLTDINEYLADVHDKTLSLAFRRLAEAVRAGDVEEVRAAGIKVEAE
ncbi:hypothetical protein [Klebsiella pneumoniae]|uniref:hypothetical protein n=1 Tax=Klebsiella pneumoniae TaxID=573 RepID=UPI00383E3949